MNAYFRKNDSQFCYKEKIKNMASIHELVFEGIELVTSIFMIKSTHMYFKYMSQRKHTACVDYPMKPERVVFIIKSKVEF